jgi:AAA domain, putative AbiEii toxin, Type IV TA system
VPQRLLDALFDARQSLDRELRGRWGLFQQGMRALEPELGRGEFDTAFDRSTGRANLVFSAGDATMAVDRLGAGVQRMVALVGSIALERATVVGLGEPELGLSPSAQQRFLRAVRAILGAPFGPTQLLFTTHSPVLGGTESAFAMEYQDGAHTIVQRAWEGAGSLPPMDDLSLDGPVGGPAPGDLDQLIGLVDQLAEIEPDALVTAAPASASRSTGQKAAAPRPSGEDKPDAAPPGTPSWKWQASEK